MAEPSVSAEPLVTASLYCSGCLDRALAEAALPLRREIGDRPWIWAVRYSRGGEHLKLRIHAAPEREGELRAAVEEACRRFLAVIGPPPADAVRVQRADAPPIDADDGEPEPPPDRSFRFTRYRASQVSLGGEPYLSDPGYRARMAECLARACDMVLAEIAEAGSPLIHARRQRLMLHALLAALSALGLSAPQAARYCAYHRDWLIRAPLLDRGDDEERAQSVLGDLERRGEAAARTVEILRAASGFTGGDGSPAPGGGADPSPWGGAVRRLRDYVGERFDLGDERPDPFAADTFAPVLIKLLHGLANVVGLKALDEAYALHLVLLASSPEAGLYRQIDLVPPPSTAG